MKGRLQAEKAVADGYDVRSFMGWTLIDNFEWNFAWQVCQQHDACSCQLNAVALHVAAL